MSSNITLRLATFNDSKTLFNWRNNPKTRRASHNTARIKWEEHKLWLKATLQNPNRRLYIAEQNGVPVGTVRADLFDGVYELSWTVSPEAQGRGIGKNMVAILAKKIKNPIRAEIKVENSASAKIAEYAGMTFDYEKNGVMYYSRGPLVKDNGKKTI